MKNIGSMLKQAQQMQTKMGEMQEKLAGIEITGSSGGGMVEITLSGKNDARKLRIDPALVKEGEGEVLEDLIVAAFNDAKSKVEAEAARQMSELTGGLNLPAGLKLPF